MLNNLGDGQTSYVHWLISEIRIFKKGWEVMAQRIKALVTKADAVSSGPWAHIMEGENWDLQVALVL